MSFNNSINISSLLRSIPPAPPSPHISHSISLTQTPFSLRYNPHSNGERDPTVSPSHRYAPTAYRGKWHVVDTDNPAPCQRSLHAGAVWRDCFLVFGGYDGTRRVNDLHAFSFTERVWTCLHNGLEREGEDVPSPRDRHVAVVHEDVFYVFGGFDGVNRVNDLHGFDFNTHTWFRMRHAGGVPPSPRHSHTAVVASNSMYVFGGYDGLYKNDFFAFEFATRQWREVVAHGEVPRPRYRGSLCVADDTLILHGGHDGSRHLQDTHTFSLLTETWVTLPTHGALPSPRDSHVCVVYKHRLFLYGGSTGVAMSDFHELSLTSNSRIEAFRWSPVRVRDEEKRSQVSPGSRFCHVGVTHGNSFYVFGGYDGTARLNDFLCFTFEDDPLETAPSSTLVDDLRLCVNSPLLSDVQFIVQDRPIHAHKILCIRSPYFRNLLTGEYMESTANQIVINDVDYDTFLQILTFIYTDTLSLTLQIAFSLFPVADRFSMDSLKMLCEREMLFSVSVENVSEILFYADQFNATNLRERCLEYVITHFDLVSSTASFEEMGRGNNDLLFEILRRRLQT